MTTAERTVAEFERYSRIVTIAGTLAGVLTDADDHKILECAVSGGATHIVTGDRRRLLPLEQFQSIRIVAPADFLTIASQTN